MGAVKATGGRALKVVVGLVLAAIVVVLGGALLIGGALTPPVKCIAEYKQPRDSVQERVMVARDELRTRGYVANASGDRWLTLRVDVERDLWSRLGLGNDDVPAVENEMAGLLGPGQASCYIEPLYD